MSPAPARNRASLPFEAFGLTELESRVYALLLGRGAMSGYAVAKAVHKSLGSIYKVLERLEGQGAVLAGNVGGTKAYRATPIDELVTARHRAMRRAADSARALTMNEPTSDPGVYALTSREQTLERARAMLAEATDFCIITATPVVLRELHEAIEATATRAVHVGVKAFVPVEMLGVRVALDPRGPDAVACGPGEWLTISADARELLTALFDHEVREVRSAWWTRHTHLNWSLFTGQGSDFILAAVRSALASGATGEQVSELIASFAPFQTPRSASKRELMVWVRAPKAE